MKTPSLASSLLNAAHQANETATFSAITVAARLPIFASGLLNPTHESMSEWNLACNEKVTALWEGAFAASNLWSRMIMKSVFHTPTPMGFAHDLMQVSGEALLPAQRCVKANARRLTKSKRK